MKANNVAGIRTLWSPINENISLTWLQGFAVKKAYETGILRRFVNVQLVNIVSEYTYVIISFKHPFLSTKFNLKRQISFFEI